MKDWTADEIKADLKQADVDIESGKVKLISLDDLKKHMDKTVARLKRQRAKEQRSDVKKTGQRRISQAV